MARDVSRFLDDANLAWSRNRSWMYLMTPEDLELPLAGMTGPLDWAETFGRSAPCAVEIGTGNGYFLENEAARLPDWNFIGIERCREFYHKMVKRCARRGLTNVRTARIEAEDLLGGLMPAASVERIYLYFSDPWPKRRHAVRRVLKQSFLDLAGNALVPGGELWFKTDVGWHFNLAVTAVRSAERWELIESRKLPPPDESKGEVYSNFERKAREQGREVWGFKAKINVN